MMSIPFILKIFGVHFNDPARNMARLGIPSYMIAHLKLLWHKF